MSDTEETRPLINSNTLDQPPVYSFYQFSDDHPAVSGILQTQWLKCRPDGTVILSLECRQLFIYGNLK